MREGYLERKREREEVEFQITCIIIVSNSAEKKIKQIIFAAKFRLPSNKDQWGTLKATSHQREN